MIADDDLAYIFCCFYYAAQSKFTFPFIVSKYVTLYLWKVI